MTAEPDAAVVLAGGGGRRLGGMDKPMLRLGDSTLLDRVLAAVGSGPVVVVVGPAHPTDATVVFTREQPPGAGPAAAVAAGLAALPDGPPDAVVALLAADLPAITTSTVTKLTAAVRSSTGAGAVLTDDSGHEQLLIGAWRRGPLTAAVRRRPDWAGMALRLLLEPLRRVAIPADGDEAADIDVPADWTRWQQRPGT